MPPCVKFGRNWPSGFGEKMKMRNVTDRHRRTDIYRQTTEKMWLENLNWTFSSGELNTGTPPPLQLWNCSTMNMSAFQYYSTLIKQKIDNSCWFIERPKWFITGRQKAVGYMIWKLEVAMRFCEPILSRKN